MNKKYESFLSLNIYQIYIKSFKDSNNDGIGDINGIISKIPYLKDLGVNAVWITPFYKSPMYDNGYDISDYLDVDPKFGTLDDFKKLLSEMHKNGIKVIVDLVVNHCSTEHFWFKEAIKSKDNPYHDFFYWADKPWNDWNAYFGGPAWEYVDSVKQYYFHSFCKQQAELNWTNPRVREEVNKIVDYWIDLGVDGFRCDVLDMIAKDFDKGLNANGPMLHEYIHGIFGREKCKDIFTVGECWWVDRNRLCKLTGQDRGELTTSFLSGNAEHKEDLYKVHDYYLDNSLFAQENDLVFSSFVENHDRPRCPSIYFNNPKENRYMGATFFATLIMTMRGCNFIFQGQEFGTMNAEYDDIKDFDDVYALDVYNTSLKTMSKSDALKKLNNESRDNGRRPMVWDNSVNGGFNKGAKPWIKLHSDYKNCSLENDMKADKSVYKFYKELYKLRNEHKAFTIGEIKDFDPKRNDIIIYSRKYEDEEYIIYVNLDKEVKMEVPSEYKLVLSNNDELKDVFKPYETRIYKK